MQPNKIFLRLCGAAAALALSASAANATVNLGEFEINGSGAGALVQDVANLKLLATAVPEPSTWAMLLLGFAGIAYAAHRRTKKAALPTS